MMPAGGHAACDGVGGGGGSKCGWECRESGLDIWEGKNCLAPAARFMPVPANSGISYVQYCTLCIKIQWKPTTDAPALGSLHAPDTDVYSNYRTEDLVLTYDHMELMRITIPPRIGPHLHSVPYRRRQTRRPKPRTPAAPCARPVTAAKSPARRFPRACSRPLPQSGHHHSSPLIRVAAHMAAAAGWPRLQRGPFTTPSLVLAEMTGDRLIHGVPCCADPAAPGHAAQSGHRDAWPSSELSAHTTHALLATILVLVDATGRLGMLCRSSRWAVPVSNVHRPTQSLCPSPLPGSPSLRPQPRFFYRALSSWIFDFLEAYVLRQLAIQDVQASLRLLAVSSTRLGPSRLRLAVRRELSTPTQKPVKYCEVPGLSQTCWLKARDFDRGRIQPSPRAICLPTAWH